MRCVKQSTRVMSLLHICGRALKRLTGLMLHSSQAHLAMPSAARGDALDYGSSGVVRRILRLRRSCGTVLVLGTQFPRDLNKQERCIRTRLQMLWSFRIF
jgi:hypothetical protein